MINIEIGDRSYKVNTAETEEEKAKGLMGIKKLPEDEGMLFIYKEPQTVSFWMKSTIIPLDIIFINSDDEVISVYKGKPNDETPIKEDDVKYVLEVNQNSGIQKDDDFEIITDNEDKQEDKMLVLSPEGKIQMELEGGERIFSRKSTKILIKKAKKAEKLKSDTQAFNKACKSLGKYVFKELKAQDTRDPEYVELPDK